MLNFTVGPVMSDPEVVEVANQSTPYFRTPEFSEIMKENEQYLLKYLNAPEGSRCVFLTASGTGAMESCVMNILNKKDEVIVVNGGTFGQRFVELCELHKYKYTEVKCAFGKPLQLTQLAGLEKHTAMLINMDETSSGVLYDMKMVSDFCKKNQILLIVDAISSFLADELDMAELGAAAVITGSQKALAVQPGISVIALAPEAIMRIEKNEEVCMYLSLKEALKNGERGQTPYTPAVTILLQIHKRLSSIEENGGIEKAREMVVQVAKEFRESIQDLPLRMITESSSNAVTALHPENVSAKEVVRILKEQYSIWACPNGGVLADEVFRIGHIGFITSENNQLLCRALHEMYDNGLL